MSQHPLLKEIEGSYRRSDLPELRSGDSVRVHTLIKEGDKERVQVFEGVVIGQHRGGSRASFTVRKISYGVGVERIFPLHTSRIEKIEVVSKGQVRRARLNYLRALEGKAARIKGEKGGPGEETPAAAPEAAEPPAPAATTAPASPAAPPPAAS
jgi:large subunit ribosomal protein L19